MIYSVELNRKSFMKNSGCTGALFSHTSHFSLGRAESPVLPERPIFSPCLTLEAGFTFTELRCR